MVRAEMIGIDPVWQRIVLPSTALLRLGMVLAVVGAGAFHVEVTPAVRGFALGLGVLYACGYAAVWAGRLAPAALGATAAIDALLAGALVGGAGVHAPLAGFLVLLALAVAHMCGGMRLAALALLTAGLGWGAMQLAGVAGLISAGVWQGADFHLALEVESSYHGQPLVALTEHQIVRAALATFLLVSLSGCLAFARAMGERRRVARACSRVDALEAIVDCCTQGVSEQEFWRAVARGAEAFTGTRVLVAWLEGDSLRLDESDGAGQGWAGLHLPASARANLILRAIATGREAEAESAADLLAGSDAVAPAGGPRRARYLIVPVPGMEAALIAITTSGAGAAADGLRIVAERAAQVQRAWHRFGHEYDLETAPAGA